MAGLNVDLGFNGYHGYFPVRVLQGSSSPKRTECTGMNPYTEIYTTYSVKYIQTVNEQSSKT